MCRTLSDRAGWCATVIACLALAVVALSGCAHSSRKPPCVSHCGMLLEDKDNGSMSCDVLDKAEKTMLDEIDKEFCAKDKRLCRKQMCNQIFGWQLKLSNDVILVIIHDGVPLPAVGLSRCDSKEMWLGANKDWRSGSYPHEMFHVVQECRPGKIGDEEDRIHGPGHEGWTKDGIYDFIKDFREYRR